MAISVVSPEGKLDMIQLSARLGMQSSNRPEEVALVQRCLSAIRDRQSRPYYRGRLDGRFGPETSSAVAAFQQDNDVTDDAPGEISPHRQTVRQIDQRVRSAAEGGPEGLYTGFEEGLSYAEPHPDLSQGVFEVRAGAVPADAVPIVDEDVGAVIGFRASGRGITRIFDLDGTLVSIDEVGLQSPAFDPIDLVTIGGIVAVSVRKAVQLLGRAAATQAVGKGAAGLLRQEALQSLRAAFRSSITTPLRFSRTALAHIRNPDRHVPVHILRLAIRHGRRFPDPQNVPGLSM